MDISTKRGYLCLNKICNFYHQSNFLLFSHFFVYLYSNSTRKEFSNLMQQKKPIESICWGRLVTKEEILRDLIDPDDWESLKQKLQHTQAIQEYKCQRCSNSDIGQFAKLPVQPLFGLTKERYYCLNCLTMGRMTQDLLLYYLDDPNDMSSERISQTTLMTWQGTLSPEQERASTELISSLKDINRPHLIHAVTGAGKTEMIFPVIDAILNRGGRVAIASPRVDVCLELTPRLQEAFKKVPLILLYGGQEESYVYTSLVVCTTHQLWRFRHAFDLLIVDEVDAFPYVNDSSLHFAVERALKPQSGKLIYLTATPNDSLSKKIKNNQITSTVLPARYHRHPLPEPKFQWIGDWRRAIQKGNKQSKLFQLILWMFQLEGVQLFFIPSIHLAETLYQWLEEAVPDIAIQMQVVHAKDIERKEKVMSLRRGEIKALITTTILERGVTFEHCHVCIIGAEDRLYSKSALVQMSGRVGRKENHPTGELIYAHFGISKAMKKARAEIIDMNQRALKWGLLNDATLY